MVSPVLLVLGVDVEPSGPIALAAEFSLWGSRHEGFEFWVAML